MAKKSSKTRCPWVNLNNPLYIDYHDREWGRPLHDERMHFEMLILEGAQAGLSWETVLNKRAHYKRVMFNFDVKKVARMSEKKIASLLLDPGIIRNRLKIRSSIQNAKAFLKIQKEYGSFDKYIWGFTKRKIIYNEIKTMKDYPTKSDLSDEISKDLKKRGFNFVGSTIIYAHLQSIGIINDHSKDCYLHGKKLRRLSNTSYG